MKIMPHAEYMKKVKKMDYHQLLFIIKDAREAMEAMPDSQNNGYYQDEIHYASMELHKRSERRK